MDKNKPRAASSGPKRGYPSSKSEKLPVKDSESTKTIRNSVSKFQFPTSSSDIDDRFERIERISKKDLEGFRRKFTKLRSESSALYEDLIALRRDKMEFYENFSRENSEILDKMMDEIQKAEDDIVALEKDIMLDTETSDTSLQKLVDNIDRPEPLKETEKALRICSTEIFRRQQDYARNALESLKGTIEELRDELFGFHECISSATVSAAEESVSSDPRRSAAEPKKDESRKEYERLLRELGMNARSSVDY